MLEPTTLPIDISVWPVNAALMVTANSGADVPKATTVNPITKSEIFNEWAISAAASTSQSAPFHNISIEKMTKTMSSNKIKNIPFYYFVNVWIENLHNIWIM